MADQEDRPRYSHQAEQAVLGALILDPSLISQVLEIIPDEEMFAVVEHRQVYSVIVSLFRTGRKITPEAIQHVLIHRRESDYVGGLETLLRWTASAPCPEQGASPAITVRELFDKFRVPRVEGARCTDPCPLGLPPIDPVRGTFWAPPANSNG